MKIFKNNPLNPFPDERKKNIFHVNVHFGIELEEVELVAIRGVD